MTQIVVLPHADLCPDGATRSKPSRASPSATTCSTTTSPSSTRAKNRVRARHVTSSCAKALQFASKRLPRRGRSARSCVGTDAAVAAVLPGEGRCGEAGDRDTQVHHQLRERGPLMKWIDKPRHRDRALREVSRRRSSYRSLHRSRAAGPRSCRSSTTTRSAAARDPRSDPERVDRGIWIESVADAIDHGALRGAVRLPPTRACSSDLHAHGASWASVSMTAVTRCWRGRCGCTPMPSNGVFPILLLLLLAELTRASPAAAASLRRGAVARPRCSCRGTVAAKRPFDRPRRRHRCDLDGAAGARPVECLRVGEAAAGVTNAAASTDARWSRIKETG